jgi:copper chaperone CopZ
MSDADASSADPLHEWIDVEMTIAGLSSPADEQALSKAVGELPGIKTFTVSAGKLAVEYEPVTITKARIHEAIERAGFRIADEESGSASPIADALHHDVP